MELSVVIVNYNVRHLLDQCLESVYKALEGLQGEVFVIDNHSVDDSVLMVKNKYQQVRLVRNNVNVGFSRANNQGIRLASGKYVLLLNPDTLVPPDTFRKCIEFMESRESAGALGVRMIDGTGTFLPESKRGFPSPLTSMFKMLGLSRLFPRSKFFNRYHLGFIDEMEVHTVDVLSGAFFFVRKSVLDDVGYLDEDFFMYGEDIDLSYRISQKGYELYYFPRTTIIHYKGESTRKGSLNYVKHFYSSMVTFAKKHFSKGRAKPYIYLVHAAIYIRAFISIVSRIFKAIPMVLVDIILIYGGLLLIKSAWAMLYFGNPDYYADALLSFNFPMYTVIWLAAIYVAGGYHSERYEWLRHIYALLLGTLVILAVYGLLPTHLRSSRMIILLGCIWAVATTVFLRYVSRFGRKMTGIGQRVLIVGSEDEYNRILNFIQSLDFPVEFAARVNPGKPSKDQDGYSVEDLREMITLYRIQEVIFCTRDMCVREVMNLMAEYGPLVRYRIAPAHGTILIGSKSRNIPSELHTLTLSYRISSPRQLRLKRALDVGLSIFLIPLAPAVLILVRAPWQFLNNWWQVLSGHLSWVTYARPHGGRLPGIRAGILNPTMRYDVDFHSDTAARQINSLYAMDYSIWTDLVIFFKNLKALDRQPQ